MTAIAKPAIVAPAGRVVSGISFVVDTSYGRKDMRICRVEHRDLLNASPVVSVLPETRCLSRRHRSVSLGTSQLQLESRCTKLATSNLFHSNSFVIIDVSYETGAFSQG